MTTPAGARAATAALLAFAANILAEAGEDPAPVLCFDDADVSPDGIGERPESETWWDSAHPGLKLASRNMAGVSLSRANLSSADLGGADLSSSRGVGVVLRNARLEGTNLSDADLIGADLSGVSAGEANFSGALLEDAKLVAAQLRFANFQGAILDGADLSSADLWGGRLSGVAAERTIFRSARLDESSLVEAELSSADFTQASLRRTNLAGAKLRGANFRDANLDSVDLSGADLRGALFPNVSLATCQLTHARFAGAWLERTRLRASQIGDRAGEEVAGELEAAIDSYIVLERNFISLGNVEDASWAYRRRRRVGRALHAKNTAGAFRSKRFAVAVGAGTRWLGDAVAEWLCDYGESVGRVVRAFFTMMALFAIVYWLTGSLKTRDGFSSSGVYAVVNYLLFSLDSMTTVGTSEVALRPAGELGILLSSLQTVVGTILLGLFGFVLGARIRS